MLLKPIGIPTESIRNISSLVPYEEPNEFVSESRTNSKSLYVHNRDSKKDLTASDSAINFFFGTAGISIQKSTVPEVFETSFLVLKIAESLPEADKFLRCLRAATTTNDKNFSFSLRGNGEKECRKITDLANAMKICGVFSECNILSESIFGKLSKAGKVREFINGIWLEQYCQMITFRIIKQYAEKHGLSWELLSNVTVRSADGEKHELDLIFSIGNKVYGAEQKSGSLFSDYDKYRRLGLWLGLVPEQFLLVNSCLGNENAADCIHYFYEYYVTNTSNYEKTLLTMISNTMI